MEGATEVGAEEVGFPVRRCGAQREAFDSALAQAAQQQRQVEFGVDGIAGQRVVQLEAQMIVRGDGAAVRAERKTSGGRERCGGPEWRKVRQ